MDNYADRLIKAIRDKGNPCVVGLDPRLEQCPNFIRRYFENYEFQNTWV